MCIKSVIPSNHLLFCRPLLLPPSISPIIRVFSNESVLCIRWPKYWSFSFSISPSNEYSGLISFRIPVSSPCSPRDCQESSPHHSSKASILQRSAFFTVQFSHPYMTTRKNIALTRQTSIGRVMSLPLFFSYKFIYFNWRLISLQYCIGFAIHQHAYFLICCLCLS